MTNKTLVRLLSVPGLMGRLNDLIISRNSVQKSDNLIIFFHGDIQDYPEVMSINANTKQYEKWNLENTATILARKFSTSIIMTIKASVMRLGVKACFDNFVETDHFGEPVFQMDSSPLAHLQCLTQQVIEKTNWIESIKCIRLIGFSQGMTVVNQLIHSMNVFNQSPDDEQLKSFISLIEHIYWLDGGKCWLTDEKIILTLKDLNISGHIAVTPLQVCNPDRSENQINYKIFKSHLDALKITHEDKLYYKNSRPSFDNHFQLLTDFDP